MTRPYSSVLVSLVTLAALAAAPPATASASPRLPRAVVAARPAPGAEVSGASSAQLAKPAPPVRTTVPVGPSVTLTVFDDVNDNGVLDAGELGVPDIGFSTSRRCRPDAPTNADVLTGADGVVTVVGSTTAICFVTITSNGTGTALFSLEDTTYLGYNGLLRPDSAPVVLTAAVHVLHPALLTGRFVVPPGELHGSPSLAGLDVTAVPVSGSGCSAVTARTQADGSFRIVLLAAADCVLRLDVDTYDVAGVYYRPDSDPPTVTVTPGVAPPPVELTGALYDETVHPATLTQTYFWDVDGDGARGPDEPVVPGLGVLVQAQAQGCTTQPVTLLTNGSGRISIPVDVAGYCLVFTGATGQAADHATYRSESGSPVDLSDGDVTQDVPLVRTAPPATTQQVLLALQLFTDVNGDGVQEQDEKAAAGTSFELTGDCIDPLVLASDGAGQVRTEVTEDLVGCALTLHPLGDDGFGDTFADARYPVSTPADPYTLEPVALQLAPTAGKKIEGSFWVSPTGLLWREDEGEDWGLDAVTVTLTPAADCRNSTVVTTATRDRGYFAATVTKGCTYDVAFTQPPGTSHVLFGAPVTRVAAAERTWVTEGVTIGAVAANPDTHTGTVWFDVNGDGVWDPRTDFGGGGGEVDLTPVAGQSGACADTPAVATVTTRTGFWAVTTPACDYVVSYSVSAADRVTRTSNPAGVTAGPTDVVHADNHGFDGVYGRLELGYTSG